jgi:hypothetical protein
MQLGSTCASVQQKKMSNILCPAAAQQIRNPNLPIIYSQSGSNHWSIFTSYNKFDFFCIQMTFTVKPCGRTTKLAAGLHCQAQQGRRTELDEGGV